MGLGLKLCSERFDVRAGVGKVQTIPSLTHSEGSSLSSELQMSMKK